MHEYASDPDLRSRHAEWESHAAGNRVWDQPPSGLHYTDFTVDALVRVVMAGNPAVIRSVGEEWGVLGAGLAERADDVQAGLKTVTDSWEGSAVEVFAVMVKEIVESLREVSATALEMRDVLLADADLLTQARTLLSGSGAGAGGSGAAAGST